MPTLAEIVDLLHGWYPPATADSWDAVGLVVGDPDQPVARVVFAVDPTLTVCREAAAWDADLLIVHHPLLLKPVHGIARTTPKGRALGVLQDAGCALLTAHTNADQALGGVSEALALRLGLTGLAPIRPQAEPAADPATGTGRIGDVEPTTLVEFVDEVVARLPRTAHGVRVAGEPSRVVRRVAVCGGSGDFLLDEVRASDADVYLTSDLRHHPASEFLEYDNGPALVDVAHWAAEWTWLPVIEDRLRQAVSSTGDTVETRVSTTCTDPWTHRASG